MDKTVAEEHPELYHYTTAVGLEGILRSQQLRATNIAYLNDAEEHIGFFDRRLPIVLEDIVRKIITDVKQTPGGQSRIDHWGGEGKAFAEAEQLRMNIRNVTLEFNSPYVTSFCPASKFANDGLLSQWRGYGLDGGYAIVFESKTMEQLLFREADNFHYQTSFWGDTEYYDEDTPARAKHPETIKQEGILQAGLKDYFLTGKQEAFDELHEAITKLACSHKHHGFAEEREVRIVAVPVNDSIREEALKEGEIRSRKTIRFAPKEGTAVPYIMLFEPGQDEAQSKLPIKKIIVGPHPDRENRRRAIDLMLKRYGVDAETVVSEIPFLGR
jgi:Protein of unknown function (DUF2971)